MNNELDQEASRPIAADDREAVGLRPIIAGYLRQRTVILISAIISLVAAIIYLLVYPKTYFGMHQKQFVKPSNSCHLFLLCIRLLCYLHLLLM